MKSPEHNASYIPFKMYKHEVLFRLHTTITTETALAILATTTASTMIESQKSSESGVSVNADPVTERMYHTPSKRPLASNHNHYTTITRAFLAKIVQFMVII